LDEENPNRGTSMTFFVLMWVILFALVIMYFDKAIDDKQNPNSNPNSTQTGSTVEVVLQRNAYGHFVSTGYANGAEVLFMVDTGATDVVLSEEIARAAGLSKGRAQRADTANGTITVYSTVIDALRIGEITLRNVDASINPHMDGDEALLGMSFLRQLEMRQKGRTLTLIQSN